MRRAKMAAAGGLGSVRGLWAPLLVLALSRVAVALTEQYPTLSLLKQELNQQRQGLTGGCASAGEWTEQYSAECGESASGRQPGAPRGPAGPGRGGALRGGCRPAGCCAGAARDAGPAGSGLRLYRAESPRTETAGQVAKASRLTSAPSPLRFNTEPKRLSPSVKIKSALGAS